MTVRDATPQDEFDARMMGLLVAAAIEMGRAAGGKNTFSEASVIKSADKYKDYLITGKVPTW